MTEHPRTGDLERLLRILRRRRRLIALCTAGVAVSALVFSLAQDKQYSASASLLFRDPAIDQTLFQASNARPVDPQRQAATNERLVSLPAVAASTAGQLGGRVTAETVRSKVKVENDGQADVVSVTATDGDPQFAAALANVFAARYIDLRREADQAVIRRGQEVVKDQLSRVRRRNRRKLESRADDLRILAALQTGKAELVQSATSPSSPSSPKPFRNTILGIVLGLILALGLALLIDRLDRRIKDQRELEEAYGLRVLGTVPEIRALKQLDADGGMVALKQLSIGEGVVPGPEWEAFRKLRTKLRYFNVDRELRKILITSAAAQEGKTTVSVNLAIAAAMGGQMRVLLLEADMRRPSFASRHGLARTPGLSELLTRDVSVGDAVQRLSVPEWSGSDTVLDVIVAGTEPPNPSELLESHKMAELIGELDETYDMIIIDTPPVSVVADAMPLVRHVDGVIVVGWIGSTTRDGANHLKHELENLNAPTLGVVVNRSRGGADSYYGYGYGNGYGSGRDIDLRSLEVTRPR